MKRTATILAALLTLGAVLGITACEPKATVSVEYNTQWAVAYNDINGIVTPFGATKRVTLQRTVGGKWVDWMKDPNPFDADETLHTITATVNKYGNYSLTYFANFHTQVHLRVRTDGGQTSRSFYITPRD